MLAPFLLVFVSVALTASAGYALWWAICGGQFSNFAKGATSIFDEEEPLGLGTDAFPDRLNKGRKP